MNNINKGQVQREIQRAREQGIDLDHESDIHSLQFFRNELLEGRVYELPIGRRKSLRAAGWIIWNVKHGYALAPTARALLEAEP